MQISSRFTIAVHIFTCIEVFGKNRKITSEFLSGSINVNPVVIRRLLLQLKAAGLLTVSRGALGGASLTRPSDQITLLDIYNAVECVESGELFHFHEHPNPECLVGGNIRGVLNEKLIRAQSALEKELRAVTLADITCEIQKRI